MAESESPLRRFWHELRRRRVPKVAAFYAVVGWGVIEIATATFPYLGIPDWGAALVIALVLLGFPLAMVLAWAYDLTAEGIRASPVPLPGRPPISDGAPWRGRRLALAVVTAAGLAALAFGGMRLWRTPAPETSVDVVAVFPFQVQGSADLAYLGEGMVNLLSTKLDGAGTLRSVDPRALLSRLAGAGDHGGDPEAAAETARRLGAGRLVLGDVVQGGDRITVNASLYQLGPDEPHKLVDGTAEGPAEAVFTLVDEVAAQLLAEAVGGPAARVRRIAAVTTPSLPAFKAYLEGDVAFREGRYAEAVEALEGAVALDSLFALAWYRLSLATEYRGLARDAQAAAHRALENAGRLSDRDRRMLEAFLAWRSGDSHSAERLYRAHVSTYPDDVEAWFELGEVLFHLNPLRGRSFLESEEAFRRVLSYEPGHAGSLIHLIRIAYAHRDLASMDTLVTALEQESGDRTIENQALQAFAHGDSVRVAEVLTRLGTAGVGDIGFALWVVGTYGANFEGADAITGIMIRPQQSPEVRAVGHATRAFLALARGRWRESRREIAAVEPLDPTMALEYDAWLQLMPIAPTDGAALVRLRDRLVAMDSAMLEATVAIRNSTFNGHNGQHRLIRHYLLGLTSASLGDRVAADSFAAAVLRHRDAVANPDLLNDYAGFIRARLLLQRGRPAEAMVELERLNLAGAYPLFYSPFHNFSMERFTIGESLMALGRQEEALGWYANIVGTSTLELVFLNPGRLRRGEILEGMGRTDEAKELYRAFLDSWSDPDPELASLRDEARRALQRLTAEG
jgi:tetratricopeptide (TPR) repeat protein